MTSLEKYIFMEIRQENIVSTQERRLTLAYEGLQEMPHNLVQDYARIVEILDLSYNRFRHLEFLSHFENLTTLIVDHNQLDADVSFPTIPSLTTLWLNSNLIDRLHPFVETISRSFPKLKFLSLMGNRGAPSYLNGGTYFEYLHYRLFIISWLPRLQYLDDHHVTPAQRQEARRLYGRPFYRSWIKSHAPILNYLFQVQDKLRATWDKALTISNAISSTLYPESPASLWRQGLNIERPTAVAGASQNQVI